MDLAYGQNPTRLHFYLPQSSLPCLAQASFSDLWAFQNILVIDVGWSKAAPGGLLHSAAVPRPAPQVLPPPLTVPTHALFRIHCLGFTHSGSHDRQPAPISTSSRQSVLMSTWNHTRYQSPCTWTLKNLIRNVFHIPLSLKDDRLPRD